MLFVLILDSSSESSSEDDDSDRRSSKKPVETPVVILSEKEMNELGAKILKADLMGNEVSNE